MLNPDTLRQNQKAIDFVRGFARAGKPIAAICHGPWTLIDAGLRVKALAHITSTGFLNLSRAAAPVGYVLDKLPEIPAVFRLLQRYGGISDSDMFFTYNMGIGFCLVVSHRGDHASRTLEILQRHDVEHVALAGRSFRAGP